MQPDRTDELVRLLRQRILVMDGAMGTMLQQCKLTPDDFRGHFHDHSHELAGDNDLLVLTRPDVVRDVHDRYLAAGADIIETNTFSATSIAQADYGMEGEVHAMNRAAARIAREAADAWTARTPGKPGTPNQTLRLAGRSKTMASAAKRPGRSLSVLPSISLGNVSTVSLDETIRRIGAVSTFSNWTT